MSKATDPSPPRNLRHEVGDYTHGILVQWRGLWARLSEDLEQVNRGGIVSAEDASDEWGGTVTDAMGFALIRDALRRNDTSLLRAAEEAVAEWADECKFGEAADADFFRWAGWADCGEDY